jgi:hypothetical protein
MYFKHVLPLEPGLDRRQYCRRASTTGSPRRDDQTSFLARTLLSTILVTVRLCDVENVAGDGGLGCFVDEGSSMYDDLLMVVSLTVAFLVSN